MFGFLLVDKPYGISSHDAIYAVRRALGIKKVGHSGTLDPRATGLLLIAVGNATRLLRYVDDEPKVYTGTIVLGINTTTQDTEGDIVDRADASHLSLHVVQLATQTLLGDIEQVPPMFSAVKVDGKRLYKSARAGEDVERRPRSVTVHGFEILNATPGEGESLICSFVVTCSTGTYVRTLGHDLGNILGVGAHLGSLRRTAMGSMSVDAAVAPELSRATDLLAPEAILTNLPQQRPPRSICDLLRRGIAVQLSSGAPGELIALLDEGGLFCIARRSGALWQPETVLAEAK